MRDRDIPGKNGELSSMEAREVPAPQRFVWDIMDKKFRPVQSKQTLPNQQADIQAPSDKGQTEFPLGADTYVLANWMHPTKNRMVLEVNPNSGRLTIPLLNKTKRGRVYTITYYEEIATQIVSEADVTRLGKLKVGIGDIQLGLIPVLGRLNAFIDGMPIDTIMYWDRFTDVSQANQLSTLAKLTDVLKPGGEILLQIGVKNSSLYNTDTLEQTISKLGLQVDRTTNIVNRNGQTRAVRALKPERR